MLRDFVRQMLFDIHCNWSPHDVDLNSGCLQYLGAKKLKKRVVKPSEKFRFSFDWENTEDTSGDMNPM